MESGASVPEGSIYSAVCVADGVDYEDAARITADAVRGQSDSDIHVNFGEGWLIAFALPEENQ